MNMNINSGPGVFSEIEWFLLKNLARHRSDIARWAADEKGISRRSVNKHLAALVDRNVISATGRTRAREYQLVENVVESFTFPISEDIEEDVIWRKASRAFENLPKQVADIAHYSFTEMVNNVVDHSEGQAGGIRVIRSAVSVDFHVMDDGVGIFRKIARYCGMNDERGAILELSKGKFTTDPSRHTGEGIFFTSRMCDQYSIVSRGLSLGHSRCGDRRRDFLLRGGDDSVQGTGVMMGIDMDTETRMRDVFDEYTGEDNAFNRTVVPVEAARMGDENLVSRSQAKRLLRRIDQFTEVILDFEGVQEVGPAFADEIFRVFARQHPEIEILPTNAEPAVLRMIMKAWGDPRQPDGE